MICLVFWAAEKNKIEWASWGRTSSIVLIQRVWEPSLGHVYNIDGLHNTCWLASTCQTYPEILPMPSEMI